jgi:hypothetical protein
VSQIGRTMVEAEESHALRGVLQRLRSGGASPADALSPRGSEEAAVNSDTSAPPPADPQAPMQPT